VTATALPPAPATRGRAADPRAARAQSLAALEAEPFDLLVVGGGITGAGVARDAARRGLRVALIEGDDFASGTSSRSSRLVHGGVRYLEHGHLGLVFEASRERRILLRTAPHLVRPLAFTWPVYRGARVPRWKLVAGLALYDALALFRNVALHRPLGPASVRAAEPALADDGLVGGARYWDAATDDARLTLATALDAAAAGAVVVNHAAVRTLTPRGPDGLARVGVEDLLGGARPTARAHVVVNAAGPWADRVRRLVEPGAPDAVLGAKGVHVAVPAARVGNRGAVTLLSPLDGRVLFALPAGPCTILGTTETPAERGPDEVRATAADVAYLLRSANHFFPSARLTRDDVVSAWAGIRPLAASARAGGRDAGTGSASREHVIERDARGLVTVSGGKLTTYRAMAAQIVEAALSLLPDPGPRRGADTDTRPLPGGDLADDEMAQARRTIGDDAIASRLVQAHGTRWREPWAIAAREPSLASRLVPSLPYIGAELVYAARCELACTLADLLVRRTPIAFETRDAGREVARAAAPIVAPVLGWDAAAVRRAIAEYDRESERLFGIDA
jgi:glycerol-3-phosphate dehydrogenase